ILQRGKSITAIEVKSGRTRASLTGIARFAEIYRPERKLLIGDDGIPLDEFFSSSLSSWVG
ncbi:MAG: AAA family ATPase, partial [Ignavibacteria bacterium]|nr:AAA family ATPase [Ignavibacteria bacterium]